MPGLRERRKSATRRALTHAALARFAADGFEATTVEEIAAGAGVSPRTFFRYFATKDDVVLGPYLDRFADWEHHVRSAPGGRRLRDVIREASAAASRAYLDDPHFWEAFATLTTGDPVLSQRMLRTTAQVQQRAAAAIAARLGVDVDRDARPAVLAAAVMTAVAHTQRSRPPGTTAADREAIVADGIAELPRAVALLDAVLPEQPA